MSATPDNQAKTGKSVPDRGPERFWTVLSLEVKDVESKIASKEIVESSFACRSDPQPISFHLRLEFGGADVESYTKDYFMFDLRSTRPVTLTNAEAVLRTSCGTVLSEYKTKVPAHSVIKINYFLTLIPLCKHLYIFKKQSQVG